MEPGRIPLPATRVVLSHVGCAGDPRSGAAACADAQIGGVLWRRQLEHWPLRLAGVPCLQCRNVCVISAPATAPLTSRQAPRRAGQRHVSPCYPAQAVTAQVQVLPDIVAVDESNGCSSRPPASRVTENRQSSPEGQQPRPGNARGKPKVEQAKVPTNMEPKRQANPRCLLKKKIPDGVDGNTRAILSRNARRRDAYEYDFARSPQAASTHGSKKPMRSQQKTPILQSKTNRRITREFTAGRDATAQNKCFERGLRSRTIAVHA